MKIKNELADVVASDLRSGVVPVLLTRPGLGACALVETVTERLGTRAFILYCPTLTGPDDLTGVPVRNPDSSVTRETHPMLAAAIEYASAHPSETPVLLVDELSGTTNTDGLIKTLAERLPKNLRIVVTGRDEPGAAEPAGNVAVHRVTDFVE